MRRVSRAILAVGLCVVGGCASTTIPDADETPSVNRNIKVGDMSSATEPALTRTPLIVPTMEIGPDEDYTLGARDLIGVCIDDLVKPGETTKLSLEVSQSGNISLPLANDVKVKGLTTQQARAAVIQAMKRFLRAPQVTVQIDQYRSKSINVAGAVSKRGTFVIPRNRVSLVEALSLASGLAAEAGRNAIVVRATRDGGAEQFLVNLEQMLVKSNGGQMMMIEAGDTIHVPEADKVLVIGYVYKPGPYALRTEMTAFELVANAGGVIPRQASASEVWLRRRKSDGNFEIHKLDMEEIAAGQASDVILAAGDTIVVPQTGSRFAIGETWDIIKGRIPGVPTGGFN